MDKIIVHTSEDLGFFVSQGKKYMSYHTAMRDLRKLYGEDIKVELKFMDIHTEAFWHQVDFSFPSLPK